MKRYILGLVIAGFSYVTITGFSNGGGSNSLMGNRTGAGGTPNNCSDVAGCHGNNASDFALDIYLVTLTNDTIKNGRYVPNQDYKIKVYGYTTGSFPEFGFQLATEKFNSMGAGYYIPTAGLQANSIGAYEVIEHLNPLPSSNGNHFSQEINWLAPQSGSGQIKFYLTMLASNDNGAPNGDKVSNIVRTYNPGAASVEEFDNDIKFSLYPNPVKEVIHLSMDGAQAGIYQLNLYGLAGQLLQAKEQAVFGGASEVTIDAANIPSGMYFLHVSKEGKRKVLPLVKQ